VKFLVVLVSLFLLAAGPAHAAWRLISQAKEFDLYVDPSTVSTEGVLRQGFVMADYMSPQDSPSGPFRSSITVVEVDCAAKRQRNLMIGLHAGPKGTGKIVVGNPHPGPWSTPRKESTGEDMNHAICQMQLR
jgi:hypothetical protein